MAYQRLKKMLAVTLLAGMAVAPAHASELKIRLGWVTTDHPTDLYAVGAREFKDRLETLSDGRVEVELYPNRQLGEEKELLEGIQFGTVDAALIVNGVLATIVPAFQVNDLPFIYSDASQAQRILDGQIGESLAHQLHERGVVVLGFMGGGFRHMLNNIRPVHVPDDVHSVKYRVQQSPVFISMFSALGGNAIPMAWGETFTALQQGTIDGIEMPVAFIVSGKFYEVTRYLSLTNHIYNMVALTMSRRVFDGLPEDIRALVIEAGAEATKAQRERSVELDQAALNELETLGMEINLVEDLDAFRRAVLPTYEQFRPTIGSDLLDAVLDAIQ